MVIVIGATGFIGTYLVNNLITEGYEVLAVGRRVSALDYYRTKGISVLELDISNKADFNSLPGYGVEAVILLAGLLPANSTIDDPYAYVETNINGTLNVLEYCKKNNITKIITTTSYADIQGYWQKDIALIDDTPRKFNLADDHACYIISKNAAADFVLHYNMRYGMSGAIFRLPPVYGVGPHSEIYVDGKLYKSGFQHFIDKAAVGETIEILGDKNVSRDVVSVKDVSFAFVQAIKSDNAKGIYNISSGLATTLEEQVIAIIDAFSPANQKSEIVYSQGKKNNSKSYLLDINRAKTDFGYEPRFKSFKDLIIDYKQDLLQGNLGSYFADRKKK